MKSSLITFAMIAISVSAACDVQSGITKKSVEKYGPTPAPSISATPVLEPIDPADVVQVDTSIQGPLISVNNPKDKMNLVCDKYNRVMVNGGDKVVTVKGACSQIMLNGNGNKVTAEAVMEIVFNGSNNEVRYSRYGNGNRPNVVDNKGGNISEKIDAPAK